MKPVDLYSALLHIRPFREADLDSCIRFREQVFGIDEAPAAVERWLRWTIDSYHELAKLGQPPYADYAIDLRDSGAFVGSIGIVPTVLPWGALKGTSSDGLLRPEIGLFWGILPEYRRRGYAAEAANRLLDYLFQELRISQVVATTNYDNIASQGTMKKLGMHLLRNPNKLPEWCQVVGQITNPDAS